MSELPPERSVPPGQRLLPEAPVMHYGRVPGARRSPWTFVIGGATADGVEHTLALEQVLAAPALEVSGDMHCGTGWSVLDRTWSGVSTAALVDLAPPAPGVRSVLVFAEYGYAANVDLDDLTSPRSVLATAADGEPLTDERGAPLRLVIPHLYTWKGPKWVRGWNYLTDADADLGFWETRGYHPRGDAWLGQRYAHQADGTIEGL